MTIMGNSETRRQAAAARRERIRAKAPGALPPEGGPPRFVADVMLGKLAKWLRIAGYDVLYSNRYGDEELVALSRDQGRILLTMDTGLLVRRSVGRFLYLERPDPEGQLREVFDAVGAAGMPRPLSRCLGCNEPLAEAPRESVRGRVPPFVFATHARFTTCPKCGKVYWSGTHCGSAWRTLDRLLPRHRRRAEP